MAVHVVPVEVAVELVLEIDEELEVEEVELEELEELEDEDVEATAVKRHEQAVDTLEGKFEHWVAYVGSPVVAVKTLVVYVAQKVAAAAEDPIKALKQLS